MASSPKPAWCLGLLLLALVTTSSEGHYLNRVVMMDRHQGMDLNVTFVSFPANESDSCTVDPGVEDPESIWRRDGTVPTATQPMWAYHLEDLVAPGSCAFMVSRNASDPMIRRAHDTLSNQPSQSQPRDMTSMIIFARSFALKTDSIRTHLLYKLLGNPLNFEVHKREQAIKVQRDGPFRYQETAQGVLRVEVPMVTSFLEVSPADQDEEGSEIPSNKGNKQDENSEDEYEGAELEDHPNDPREYDPAAHETNALFDKTTDDGGDEQPPMSADESFRNRVDMGAIRTKYQDAFPEEFEPLALYQDKKWFPAVPAHHEDIQTIRLENTAHSTHVATAAKVYAADVSKRAFTILLEEEVTTSSGEKSKTMFLNSIIKLFAAPFVAVLYTPVGQPLGRGIGGGNKMGIAGPAGLGFAAIMFILITFPVGIMLGIVLSNMLAEGLTFIITWQVTYGVARRVPKACSDGIISKVNDYLGSAAAPAMRDVVKNLLIDVLSDSISNSLHHTLVKSLTERLSSTLTPATTHYYYCVYCYYYGDYCDVCYKTDDYTILHKMWTIGAAGEQSTFDSGSLD